MAYEDALSLQDRGGAHLSNRTAAPHKAVAKC
ncbi:hypothetical protein LMG29542_05000 [Paraburkholderia humisilvae]|uniref:Uncharacterized protein n=1 Tax=Paraburkholderia humisilvae TaxID=627669 RepID=A0A6J5EF20_9BURK|nr:hypothetical protein LMG29542_05000 [Paraburkholderia humisilvae]